MDDEEVLRQQLLEQQLYNEAQLQEQKRLAAERKARNNANTLMAAANALDASGHPVASTIGKGVKVADRLTGGKSTHMLGKAVTGMNNAAGVKGKVAQHALNKVAESGIANRISQAAGKKNGTVMGPTKVSGNSNDGLINSKPKDLESQSLLSRKNKKEDDNITGGEFDNLSGNFKLVKYGLIVTACMVPVMLIVAILMTTGRVYQVASSLGQVDNLTDRIDEDIIDKKIKDGSLDANNAIDVDSDKIKYRDNKLNELNLVKVATKKNRYLRRKYNEATLEEIEDFYPAVVDLSKNYDEKLVYDFFFKMYNLYTHYNTTYPVDVNDDKPLINLPLLMSTLMMQSDDMYVIFESNLEEADRKDKPRSKPVAEYAYDYNWSGTILSKDSSVHDMEILAQHMVSKQVKEMCKDASGNEVKTNILKDNEIGTVVLICDEGETYSTSEEYYAYDEEKYKEFLKEFLEKKYYLNEVPLGNISGGYSGSVASNFKKYTFEGDLLEQIASVCYREQGSAEGAAAEASLIANKFEYSSNSQKYKDQYGDDGLGLYHYLRESGWWANPSKTMEKKNAPSDVVEAVRSVLVDGKRTLPRYVDEHDCWNCNASKRCGDGKKGDICSLNTNGKSSTSMSEIKKRANYVANQTIIKNVYDSTYTFYTFPTSASDPFGYISEKLRQTVGECYYDYNTGLPVNCGSSFVFTFLSWLKDIAEDDSHGYSQIHRESLIDFDCSSLVYFGLLNSGFTTEQLGNSAFTTRREGEILKENGFEEIRFSDLVPDGKTTTNLEAGDILVSSGHTEVYIGEGMNVGAHMSETGGKTGEYGDQTGKEISITNFWNDNWQYVYRYRG